MNRMLAAGHVLLFGVLFASPAHAWVLSEHTEITADALARLAADTDTDGPGDADTNAATLLQKMLPLVEQALRLCPRKYGDPREDAVEPETGCVTFEDLPTLAADHSCSPAELSRILAAQRRGTEHWVDEVLAIAKRTGRALNKEGAQRADLEEVRRQMHIDLQFSDPDYLKRALQDFSHFQLPREGMRVDHQGLIEYLQQVLAPGREANATASYVNYHLVAIRLLTLPRAAQLPDPEVLAQAFLAEAFALHFLEDSFAAGHFVGHWGDDATRLGTHDFYSAVGIMATRWGEPSVPYVARGDGFMSDQDSEAAARAVAESLTQVLQAAENIVEAKRLLAQFGGVSGLEEYDACACTSVSLGLAPVATALPLLKVLLHQPVPTRTRPSVARVRAEKGVFFGGAAAGQVGYSTADDAFEGLGVAAVRVGYGAAGIVNDPINAQAFLEAGFVGQRVFSSPAMSVTGYSFRLRAPGYISLVDGLPAVLLAELLKPNCNFCFRWAAAAASGGALRLWKGHHLVGPITFQFSLLRDVTLHFFRNEPNRGEHRFELLAPLFTARSFLPIKDGEAWSQSSDFYFDIGPSMTWSTLQPKPGFGVFISLSMAARLFT